MPRPLRNFIPGRIYLISQQGNKQSPVYVDDEDRLTAARLLQTYALRYSVTVLAFGFGEWEGRWLLRCPSSKTAISFLILMRDMQSAYSRYLNTRHNHRPCCAAKVRDGSPPCHAWNTDIRDSSNWTPRFKCTEIAPELYGTARELVLGVAGCMPARIPSQARHLLAMRIALRRSRPLGAVIERLEGRRQSLVAIRIRD